MDFWYSVIFWLLMAGWIILGIKGWWPLANTTRNTHMANIVLWLLFFLVGLRFFTFPLTK